MVMIKVSGVSKSFGRLKALDSISFSIAKGEVVGLLGPNGAGKTTAMRILTSFLSPDSGSVTISGVDVFANPSEVKRIIGYLPENTPLYTSMSVREFLVYCARLKGVSGGKTLAAVQESLERCRLTDVSRRIIGKLSKGFRQRVGLAQALLNNPSILILDEPTVGLDPSQVVQVRNLIKELSADRTIILSTHILPEVEAVCQKVIIIHRGRIVKESSISELSAPAEGTTKITVEIRGNIEAYASACNQIPGVSSVGWADGRFIIEASTEAESMVRERLFHAAVATGSVIAELRRDRVTLETIFLDLTKEA